MYGWLSDGSIVSGISGRILNRQIELSCVICAGETDIFFIVSMFEKSWDSDAGMYFGQPGLCRWIGCDERVWLGDRLWLRGSSGGISLLLVNIFVLISVLFDSNTDWSKTGASIYKRITHFHPLSGLTWTRRRRSICRVAKHITSEMISSTPLRTRKMTINRSRRSHCSANIQINHNWRRHRLTHSVERQFRWKNSQLR